MQLNFLWKELQGYTGVMSVLKTASTVLAASNVVLLQFERPADQSEKVQKKRAEFGQTFYNKYAGKAAAPTPPAVPAKPSAPVAAFKVGDAVQFGGGGVYGSANAAIPAHSRGKSRCKVTQTYNGKHPYHLVSEDGADVHGWVDAMDVSPVGAAAPKSIDDIAREVIAGKWGSGQDRKNRLTAAGYDYNAVQNRVNALLK
jgi:hypothetical protein